MPPGASMVNGERWEDVRERCESTVVVDRPIAHVSPFLLGLSPSMLFSCVTRFCGLHMGDHVRSLCSLLGLCRNSSTYDFLRGLRRPIAVASLWTVACDLAGPFSFLLHSPDSPKPPNLFADGPLDPLTLSARSSMHSSRMEQEAVAMFCLVPHLLVVAVAMARLASGIR